MNHKSTFLLFSRKCSINDNFHERIALVNRKPQSGINVLMRFKHSGRKIYYKEYISNEMKKKIGKNISGIYSQSISLHMKYIWITKFGFRITVKS